MNIELGEATFRKIHITIEDEEDQKLLANLLILAQEHPTIIKQEYELANGLLSVLAPDEVSEFEEEAEVASVDIDDGAPSL